MFSDEISLAVVKTDMSLHDSVLFMAIIISSISLSLFIFWLCLDSESTMNRCGSSF